MNKLVVKNQVAATEIILPKEANKAMCLIMTTNFSIECYEPNPGHLSLKSIILVLNETNIITLSECHKNCLYYQARNKSNQFQIS